MRAPAARRADARLRRQGGDVRQRRHLAEAGGENGGDEVRHVRRRRRDRGRRRDRAPAAAGAAPRGRRRHREPASGRVGQARRHRHGRQRQDDRGQQHRRRGPAGAGRLPLPRRRRGRRADRRPGDAHRRRDRRARLDLRRADEQRRRARRADHPRPESAPARSSGGCPCTRSTTSSSRGPTAISTTRPKRARPARSWAPAFLSNFVGEVPWAHLDIAGSAWDLDRAYVGKGASGLRRAPARRARALLLRLAAAPGARAPRRGPAGGSEASR